MVLEEKIMIKCLGCNQFSQQLHDNNHKTVFPIAHNVFCPNCGSRKWDWRSTISLSSYKSFKGLS